ncbi:flavin-containing monooxygenase [Burkholderia vietnamiensis]|uniref:flavin-containing monooxygenase n=1 Tax=Burkholderia vietnamiensis TaxID=60552 RepID=UPI001B9E5C5A|nr:NAD(P)-binding domain-containing protein [Burkholderia vietnamiensis]MBR8203408.1 NAD(P)-binding domain-containing protein [Burkholderia vietnamiensis]MBR8282597.1 NAD(P)-binding domain-containing protein [Burkholderia vietnamiensis]
MNASGEYGIIDRGDTACVIGAGPGGLSAARALKVQGIDYDQFERHTDVGGIWDIANPGTPMYESAHFISSRDLSGFIGFPMPKHLPDYPSNRQIVAYLRDFADAFGLRERIHFNSTVSDIEKDAHDRWIVTFGDGSRKRYRWLVLATGTNWQPNLPTFHGHFDGEIRHSITFKRGSEFHGKRVLVVGAGNSGADISCEAAQHAEAAFISLRRGYYFIPKHVFGMPADVFGESGPHLPLWLTRPIFKVLLRLLVGDLSRWGLPKPDHRLFETHPILNSQLLHHLQHGNIAVKSDIARLDGRFVVFKDGSQEQIDVVLCATGFKWGAPCAAAYFEWKAGRPLLYLSMFSRTHRNLCAIGYLDQNSSAFKLFDTQALTLASYFRAQLDGSPSASQFDQYIRSDDPDLSGGIRFVQSDRHAVYLDARAFTTYLRRLRARLGWKDLDDSIYDKPAVSRTRSNDDSRTAAAPNQEMSSHG